MSLGFHVRFTFALKNKWSFYIKRRLCSHMLNLASVIIAKLIKSQAVLFLID